MILLGVLAVLAVLVIRQQISMRRFTDQDDDGVMGPG
jgi:hypothetical protein